MKHAANEKCDKFNMIVDRLTGTECLLVRKTRNSRRERKKASNGNMLLQTQMHAFEACRVKWASQSTALTMTRFLRATTAKRIMDNNKYSMRTACYSLSSFVDCYFFLPVFWHYFSYFFIELYRMYGAFTLNILNKPMQTALANIR